MAGRASLPGRRQGAGLPACGGVAAVGARDARREVLLGQPRDAAEPPHRLAETEPARSELLEEAHALRAPLPDDMCEAIQRLRADYGVTPNADIGEIGALPHD